MLGSMAAYSWMLCVTQVVGGLMTLLFLTGANSLVQTTAAPWLRGRVMSVYILVLLGGQSVGSPAVGWLVDHFGVRPSMFLCGGMVALVTLVVGLAMARQSHLEVEVDLHREHGRSPLHIVHS
jgi:MFS family permease